MPGTVSPTSARRFASRARSRRLLSLRPLLALVATAVLVGAAVWALFFSDLLAVRHVAVSGTSRVSVAQVRARVAVAAGTPLAIVDTGAAAARVGRLAPVASVDVSRHWPHTLRVAVRERKPAVAVASGSGYALVDRAGVAFDDVAHVPSGLPVLRTDAVSRARHATLRAAVRVVGGLPQDLRTKVRQVSVQTTDDVRLRLARGAEVVWGDAGHGAAKARVLRALLHHAPHASQYDVSAPEAPAVRR